MSDEPCGCNHYCIHKKMIRHDAAPAAPSVALTEFLLARIADEVQGTATMSHRPTAARVLAECEAKRRIVELHEHHARRDDGALGDQARGTLELLALPYDVHPDYREEWRA